MAKLIIKGRGAVSNPDCRYQSDSRETVDDEWYFDQTNKKIKTTVTLDASKTIISKNNSPDVPFSHSINPYRGCEHGCIYCYARPTHAYLDLSPGLDFETKLIIKPDAAMLLEKALRVKNYQCQPLALGSNTDPYQPIERKYKLTRQVLEVLAEFNHPVAIITKSALIERDIDILAEMARFDLVEVMISVCTLDKDIARTLEPRASSPSRRIKTIERLTAENIPTGVLLAPMVPALTDPELETIIRTAVGAGAHKASYILLRLPLEVAPLFEEWLHTHYPLKADHVLTRVRDTRAGKLYNSEFGSRMRGEGPFAAMIGQRFDIACKNAGLLGQKVRRISLDTDRFRVPERFIPQMSLFD